MYDAYAVQVLQCHSYLSRVELCRILIKATNLCIGNTHIVTVVVVVLIVLKTKHKILVYKYCRG